MEQMEHRIRNKVQKRNLNRKEGTRSPLVLTAKPVVAAPVGVVAVADMKPT